MFLLFVGSFARGVSAAFAAGGEFGILSRLSLFLIAGEIPMLLFVALAIVCGVSYLYQKTRPAIMQSVRHRFAESHPDRTIRWVRIRSENNIGPIAVVLHGYTTPTYHYYQVNSENESIEDLGTSEYLPRESDAV